MIATRTAPRSESRTDVSSDRPAEARAFEEGVCALFGDLAELFGNPRSYGLIYGALFASPHPLSMEEVAETLDASMGSTSMGLRRLEEFGAVVREHNGRRGNSALFSPRLEMRLLIGGFLKERVNPRIASTADQMRTLERLLPALPAANRQIATERLSRLARWRGRAQSVLPFVQKLLASG